MEYSANGGPGFIVSIGLLKRIAYGKMEECLQRGEVAVYYLNASSLCKDQYILCEVELK